MLISTILMVIFFILSGLHFNWAVGGTFGFDQSLPTNEKGEKIFNPKKAHSAIVGIGLLAFGLFYGVYSGLVDYTLPHTINQYCKWMIPTIFFLRAIGDFKYFGFFKKIRQTEFARLDTKLFSPLCLFISLMGFCNSIFSNNNIL